jgi:triacylglycerol esterase/lipase EstA (alpha/beta hydrolase family)
MEIEEKRGLVVKFKSCSVIKKVIIILAVIVLLLVLGYIILQVYLWLNFILGNDILIRLSSDVDNVVIPHGQNKTVKFSINVMVNPFCSVTCGSVFEDISSGQVLDRAYFAISSSAIEKEYELQAKQIGTGQIMYRFNVECIGKKTILCDTKEKPTNRKILVTMEYGLNETDVKIKNSSEILAKTLVLDLEEINASITSIDSGISKINDSLLVNLSSEVRVVQVNVSDAISRLFGLEVVWKTQDYEEFSSRVLTENETISRLEKDMQNIENLIENKRKAESAGYAANLSNGYDALCTYAEICINPFSGMSEGYKENLTSEQLCNYTDDLMSGYSSLNDTNTSDFLMQNYNISCDIPFIKLSEFQAVNKTTINLSFQNPEDKCCFRGECKPCCENEKCRSSPGKYPIILVHGHDFSKDVSSDYSGEGFNDIETRLEDDGYLAAGIVSLSTPKENFGVWGMTDVPVSVRGSYYFDVYKSSSTTELIQAKSESIDTYAIRLKDIIGIVKYKTGSPKVILVTHSMGGLVSRRYVQVFGNESVAKLILIAVPNHGIEGVTAKYCPLFGEKIECSNMDKDSLFINKLNNDFTEKVNTYNIVAAGCTTDGLSSDGIVLEKNAYLESANNYYVNGSCSGTNVFHSDMLDVYKHPEVYGILKKAIKD